MTESNDESLMLKSKRSRTVPSTPMHNCDSTKKPTIEFTSTHETTSNFRNQLSKMMGHKAAAQQHQSPNESLNTSSTLNKSLYWEGPPAHFMLPTHAIHCRLSRSVERCPRACKGKIRLEIMDCLEIRRYKYVVFLTGLTIVGTKKMWD